MQFNSFALFLFRAKLAIQRKNPRFNRFSSCRRFFLIIADTSRDDDDVDLELFSVHLYLQHSLVLCR